MKALVYTGPETLAFQDVPDPVPVAGEALVEIESSGICGSDMHGYLGHDDRRPAPLILGHEAAGRALSGQYAGRDVVLNPLVVCGTCSACQRGQENICANRQIISMPPREGALAQLVAIPEQNLWPVPEGFPLDKAALCEPIACGWHATRLAGHILGGIGAETRALVLGGGAIGVGAALSLRAFGAGHVTISEPNALRRAFINANTEIEAVLPDEVTSGEGFDIMIDGVGIAATRAFASDAIRPGGVIAHIGLGGGEAGLDTRRMTLHEITFIGTYTYTARDFTETLSAILDGRLGALDWVDARPLADGAEAFRAIRAGEVAAPKIILKPR